MARVPGSIINNVTKSQLENAVKESKTIKAALLNLGITSQSYYNWFKNKVSEYNIDVSHFEGQGYQDKILRKPLEEIFINNSSTNSTKLKNRLFFEGLKKRECEDCGITSWLDHPELMLELHHVNGVNTDNRLENLKLLCRNCHGYTSNFCSKNNKNIQTAKKSNRKKRDYAGTICLDCNSEITKRSLRCSPCARKAGRVILPEKEVLLDELKTSSISDLADKYKVSYKTLKRRVGASFHYNVVDIVSTG